MQKLVEKVLGCQLVPGSSTAQIHREIKNGEWHEYLSRKSGAAFGAYCPDCETFAKGKLYAYMAAVDLVKLSIWAGIGYVISNLISQ